MTSQKNDDDAAGVLGLFGRTLTGEPPLVDMVSDAERGAADRRRRDRMTLVAAPLALMAVAGAAYAAYPGGGSGPAVKPVTAATRPGPVFPPVADSQPMNPSSDVVAAAARLCGRQWKLDLSAGSNMLPATQEEAVAMCTMSAETLMTLLPEATVTQSDDGDAGGRMVFQVTTATGAANVELFYLWPDGSYDKKHYGPFDDCATLIAPPSPQQVTGPDGKPSTLIMHDPQAGHVRHCVQTHPAPALFGALTTDATDQSIFYSVQNHGYGRFIINVSAPQGQSTEPAETLRTWTAMLTDPRFDDYLVRYEWYVLSHASAESFVVSGSKPLGK